MKPQKHLVAVNERGARIGEDHPAATLTNHDVELIFVLHEMGWGYRRIAHRMECSKTLVRKILKGELRAQQAFRFKRLP